MPLRTSNIRFFTSLRKAKTPDRQVQGRPGQQWEGAASKCGDTDYSDGILGFSAKQVVPSPPISVMAAQAATQASMGGGSWTRDLLVPRTEGCAKIVSLYRHGVGVRVVVG